MRHDPSIPALGSLEAKIMQVLWERPGEYLSVLGARDPTAARRPPRLHDRHDGDGPPVADLRPEEADALRRFLGSQ